MRIPLIEPQERKSERLESLDPRGEQDDQNGAQRDQHDNGCGPEKAPEYGVAQMNTSLMRAGQGHGGHEESLTI